MNQLEIPATQFNTLLKRRLHLIHTVLGRENYKSGNIFYVTLDPSWRRAFTKHVTFLLDYIEKGEPVTQAFIDDTIGASINYLILLEALLQTRIPRPT